jgi:general secretion pathway protein G
VFATNRNWLIGTLALVIAVIGATLWFGSKELVNSKTTAAHQRLRVVRQALEHYKADHGRYPGTEEGLSVLIDASPVGRYLVGRAALDDPWGHQYVYRNTQDPLVLYSVGPNGVDEGGKGDDISE